jgi:peptidoglycan-associated lipoprotein
VKHPPIARFLYRTAALALAGLLLTASVSCKKHVPAPAAPSEAPPPAPPPKPEPPPEVVKEAPIVPPKEPAEQVSDLDDTIRLQNTTWSILKTVHFDSDKSVILDTDVPLMQANAAWLAAHTQYKVIIEGYCDERDTIEYNLALGDRRAKAVMAYLVDLGVPANRMTTISYGEENPADPAHNETAWAKNRRAQFKLEK